jgi:hypothetical protein
VLQVVQIEGRSGEPFEAGRETARPTSRGNAAPGAYTYELRGISIHLSDRHRLHSAYAQFSLLLDCPNQAAQHAMELNHAKLLDTVLQVGNRFYLEDLSDGTGLEAFKARLLAKLEERFRADAPRRIWVRDWLVN